MTAPLGSSSKHPCSMCANSLCYTVAVQNDAPGGSWAACQRQLDAWLVDYAAAYAAEQQLMGQEGAWPNIAAGMHTELAALALVLTRSCRGGTATAFSLAASNTCCARNMLAGTTCWNV
jgi:hypothetical protein